MFHAATCQSLENGYRSIVVTIDGEHTPLLSIDDNDTVIIID